MKRAERLRWRIAELIERVVPGQCWSGLADWPLGYRRWPWAPIKRTGCRQAGGCYCGKLRSGGGR